MGKVRKGGKRRSKAIGSRATAGLEQGMNDQTPQPEQVLPVIQKLSSPDATDRAWAAACVSNLVMAGPSVRKLLLSKGTVPLLLERLSDNQYEVLEESMGALRNLVSVDPEVAKEYYKRDILTPFSVLLPKISQTIDLVLQNAPLTDEGDQDRRRTVWDLAENFIYVIWSLCEASDKYIKAVNRLNIITFLISFLSSADQCPTNVVIAAGQCLTTLTDNNKDIYIEFQNHPEYVKMLFEILNKFQDSSMILVRVLACAILTNIREVVLATETWEEGQDGSSELNKTLLPVLTASLNFDIQEAAEKAIAAVKSGNVGKHEDTGDVAPRPKQPTSKEEVYIQNLEENLSTLQLALELLADICIQDDSEEDGWEDADEEMGDGDQEPEEVTEENIDELLKDSENLEQKTSSAVDDQLIRSNPIMGAFITEISPQLIRLATLTPLSFPQEPIAPGVTDALVLTHQRALECFNNYLLAMAELPSKFWFKEHKSDACQAWRWLFNLANTVGSAQPSQARDELIEIIVGCLWSLGRGLGQEIPLETSDVTSLFGAYHATSSESMRVKIVGCLGPIALRQGAIEANKEIGNFFMEVLKNVTARQTTPAVAVEALNCIFDVYSDCAFDYDLPVFIQGNFLLQLKVLVPTIRTMTKSIDRRKNFDLRSRSDEALMNLVAFNKYKANEKRQ
ncbi:armadillo-type protein [Phascolomyces articulosus]|uniref:Armadillo-type protein n=1 Tax=Phascolomyces articulosus TaxID=60185 RepID=A0AAD5K2E6_9FUNG|nr:armadillo-type protein [Phascolomyces articulosus]